MSSFRLHLFITHAIRQLTALDPIVQFGASTRAVPAILCQLRLVLDCNASQAFDIPLPSCVPFALAVDSAGCQIMHFEGIVHRLVPPCERSIEGLTPLTTNFWTPKLRSFNRMPAPRHNVA